MCADDALELKKGVGTTFFTIDTPLAILARAQKDNAKDLIDATLQADHWVKIAIGMNMVVEGLALGAFHNMRRATTCELLRSLTNLVLRDESRHVAFGNVYVGETIRDMHPDEREDVADFEPFYLKDFIPGTPKDPLGLRTPSA